ncbi:DUF3489 domain-containing protein [Reyranella sp.]|uniref:DUF3489 domain-containing protein n=1 Tax=Reyranella sp. TaxID=1929291 RepID=UPI003C7CF943
MAKATRKTTTTKTKRAALNPAAAEAKAPRGESKQSQLIAMLKRPEGATIDEMVKALTWQSHTIRGAMSGALKKKLGLKVDSEKVDGRGRVYRVAE